MKTVRLYTPAELKKKYPEGFESALEWFRRDQTDIPWQGEIMDSFKAVFEHSGVSLRDWSISGDCPSYSWCKVEFNNNDAGDCPSYSWCKVEFNNNDAGELTGQRALAWLENNLFEGLRERRTFSNRVKRYDKWYDFTKYGEIPSCPFTGYCADEDFIESLLKDIKDGDTLEEAYKNLAHVVGKLFEQEIEYQNSEECFLEQELHFTKNGDYVYAS